MQNMTIPLRQGGEGLMRRCGPEDLAAILALQAQVQAALDDAMFVSTSPGQLAESLRDDICLGVYHADELIAFGLLIVGRETERNLGGLEDLPAGETLTLDTVFVDARFRGNRLQQILMDRLLAEAAPLGAAYAYATIAPGNPHSLQNAQALGFEICREMQYYSGVARYLMRKAL